MRRYLLFHDWEKRFENLIVLVLHFDLSINQEDSSKYGYIFCLVNLFYIVFIANTKSYFLNFDIYSWMSGAMAGMVITFAISANKREN